MKQLTILLIAIFSIFKVQAQIPSVADVPEMVALINENVNLNAYQQKEITSILTESVQEFQRIQKLDKTDVEKLMLLKDSQKNTRSSLEVVLEPQQYKNYVALLEGGTIQGNTTNAYTPKPKTNTTTPIDINNNNNNYTPPVNGDASSVATALNFSGNDKAAFEKVYKEQEQAINKVKSGGLTPQAGIDLLASILVTDFKVLDLGGQTTYQQYFDMREQGQLSNGETGGQKVDINQVYQLYNLKNTLELTDAQTKQFLTLVIQGEADKKSIRESYQGSERQRRLKAQEQEGLAALQQLLTPAQIQKLAAALGQ